MFEMPKTTYMFSACTRTREGRETEDVTIEWDTQEATLDELCERFERFLKASGFCLDGLEIQAVPVDEDDHSNCNHDEEEWTDPFIDDEAPLSFSVNPYTINYSIPGCDTKITLDTDK